MVLAIIADALQIVVFTNDRQFLSGRRKRSAAM
jgi:hypothetical protein